MSACFYSAHSIDSKHVASRVPTDLEISWNFVTWKTPGRLLAFYVRPGISGMISQFTLKCLD